MDIADTTIVPPAEHLGDFVSIESGAIVSAPEAGEKAWLALDDISLHVRDTGGCVSIVGRLTLHDHDPFGRAAITVVASHSGESTDLLEVTLGLYDFDARR